MIIFHHKSIKSLERQSVALFLLATICSGCVVAPTTGIDKFTDDRLRYDLFAVMVNSNMAGGDKVAQSKQLLLAEAQRRGKLTPAEIFKLETRARLYKDVELYWNKPVEGLTLAFGKPERIDQKDYWKIYVYHTEFKLDDASYYEEISICTVGGKVFNSHMNYERTSSSFHDGGDCTTTRLEDMFQKPRLYNSAGDFDLLAAHNPVTAPATRVPSNISGL